MRKKKPKVKESQIQSQILDFLRFTKILHWRVALGAVPHTVGGKILFKKNPMKGHFDIEGVTPKGRFWAMEIKTETGSLSEDQEMMLADYKKNNVLTCVARNLDEAIAFAKILVDN